MLSVLAHLLRPWSVGRGLAGWQCRQGKLVLQAGHVSLGRGAWWTTGCMGRPLPREMDLTAVRLGHRRVAEETKKNKDDAIRVAKAGESNLNCLMLWQAVRDVHT